MKTIQKRLITLTLCLLMTFGVFAIFASAKVYSGSCGKDGDNVRWTCDSSTNTLTISGTGEMQAFIYKTPWDYDKIRCVINTVIIEDGVTNISEGAFSLGDDCRAMIIGKDVARIDSDLQSYSIESFSVSEYNACFCSMADVLYNKDKTELIRYPVNSNRFTTFRIPDGVRIIHDKAFAGNKNVEQLTIPNTVEKIGKRAFFSMSGSLKMISVSEGNARYKSDHQGGLYDLKENTLITYPAKNGATIYSVAEGTKEVLDVAFFNCSNLHSIVLPDGLKTIGYDAFAYCRNAAFIHIPASVDNINKSAFRETNCFICNETEECLAKQYAQEHNIRFKACNGHGGVGGTLVVSLQPVVYTLGPIIGGTAIYTNEMPKWSTQQVSANVSCDELQSIEWSSSNNGVVKIKRVGDNYSGCLIRTGSSGTATISCTVTDSQGNTATDSCEITVKYTPFIWWILYWLRDFGWI